MKSDLLKHSRKRDNKTASKTLKRLQALPLAQKISLTERRITDFYSTFDGDVYVSYSGGKDSTVLLHMTRKLFPEVKGVFVDTGLEYPEIRGFVKSIHNVEWVTPNMNFREVLNKYGYPVVSKETSQKVQEIVTTKSDKLRNKRLNGDDKGNGKVAKKWRFLVDAPFKVSGQCCDVMKKRPVKKFEKETGLHPIVGTMAAESRLRKTQYLKQGCNSFSGQRPMSAPMSFWTEEDVWEYIKTFDVPYSEIYDMGEKRTGCMFCMFGCQFNDEDGLQRFDRMAIHHPSQHKFCMETLGLREVIDYTFKPNKQGVLF